MIQFKIYPISGGVVAGELQYNSGLIHSEAVYDNFKRNVYWISATGILRWFTWPFLEIQIMLALMVWSIIVQYCL